jgi:hypothetical protein
MANNQQANKPVKEFRFGAIKAAVWKREHEGRTFYSVSISRSYKVDPENGQDDGWRETNSFDYSDLATVRLAFDMAAKFINKEFLDTV